MPKGQHFVAELISHGFAAQTDRGTAADPVCPQYKAHVQVLAPHQHRSAVSPPRPELCLQKSIPRHFLSTVERTFLLIKHISFQK